MKNFIIALLTLFFFSTQMSLGLVNNSNLSSDNIISDISDRKEFQNPIDEYKDVKFQEYIFKAPKVIYDIDFVLDKYNYKQTANLSKKYIKVYLLDGDYLIGYPNVPCYIEYHKDNSVMGLITSENIYSDGNKIFQVFYEYRKGYNVKEGMGLKHILFVDIEKGKYISQYIYNADGKLLCKQENDDIYIDELSRNMLLPISKKHNNIKVKIYNKKENKKRYNVKTITENSVDVIESVAGITVAVAFFPITIPLLIWFINEINPLP